MIFLLRFILPSESNPSGLCLLSSLHVLISSVHECSYSIVSVFAAVCLLCLVVYLPRCHVVVNVWLKPLPGLLECLYDLQHVQSSVSQLLAKLGREQETEVSR